jgi:GT2 family glycosyltransferase/glycosyltransferase involved in cell wall biosynthesis
MAMQSAQNPLVQANQAYRAGHSAAAMAGYVAAMQKMPELGQMLADNITRTRQQYLANRPPDAKLKVVICGWELAHNCAGRAHTLAEIWREFAQIEIVGSLFPRWGRKVWEPMRETTIPVDTFIVEPGRFIEQAMQLVAAHPADIVHLSKPRAPNILFGVLYKLIWQARVILDIDDEELAFVHAETPLVLSSYLQQQLTLPPLDQLPDSDWTRLAVGLAHEFDAITVSNIALQQRYGGAIIGHARDPHALTPSAALRQASRLAHGIHPEQKVILFAGTPRPHKGLLEVAQAINSLQRSNILFVIAGSFGSNYHHYKEQLLAVQGVSYLFLENQALAALPGILALADCCVLLQDPDHTGASFQIPAKLSDALAMCIPVIAAATPALAGAIAAGAIIPATPGNMASQLAATLNQPSPLFTDDGYRYFTEHLSLAANAARLQQLLGTTVGKPLSPLLRQLLDALAEKTLTLRVLLAKSVPNYEPQSLPVAPMRQTHSDARAKLAIAVHVYYPELWPEIAQRLKAIQHPFVLDITTPPNQAAHVETVVKQDFPAARIHVTPNQGMDILPFLSLVPHWQKEGILAVCKLHTKRGDGGPIATHWRKHLLDTLVGHPDTPSQIAQAFTWHPQLSLVGPAIFYLSGQRLVYENKATLAQIQLALGQGPLPQEDWGFFAGTMFWARPAALAPLANLVASSAASHSTAAFSGEYAKDGRDEHALERAFGLIPHQHGAQIGLLHPPASPIEAPELQIAKTLAPATRQHINPSNASQAARQTYSLVDWEVVHNKSRQAGLVSIIIPIFNQADLTDACVASLYRHTAIGDFELILVDNGSAEPTQALLQNLASQHPNVCLVRNAENLNFAHGCNIGFAASQGDIIIFLNNDTTVTPHWMPPLVKALQLPGVAAVQPKLLYPDGTVQCIGVVFSVKSTLGYPIYAGKPPENPWANHSRSFQAVTGACMVMRAQDFSTQKGFDPIYVNGQEDIDLCLRLNSSYKSHAGWVAADSIVIHHESKTSNRFHHIAHNRRTFMQRWQNKVRRDDLDYYAADGFSVIAYQSDSPNTLPAALQIYRPQLTTKIDNHCPARADFHFSAIVN